MDLFDFTIFFWPGQSLIPAFGKIPAIFNPNFIAYMHCHYQSIKFVLILLFEGRIFECNFKHCVQDEE